LDGVINQDDITIVLRYLKSGGCSEETLDTGLVLAWRAAGGDELLQNSPEASGAVADAYVAGDQVATFFNLLDLLDGQS
jgi:hypothetical protein